MAHEKSGIRGRKTVEMAPIVAGSILLSIFLLFSACSRSGGLLGDVTARLPSGEVVRGSRIHVRLIPSTEAFERDWAQAITLFRQEVAPAVEEQKAAEHKAEEARLTWDHALTAGSKAGARSRRFRSSAPAQRLWRDVRATESLAFQARKRVREIVRKHEEEADTLLDKYATQRVQTDQNGHYALVKIPAGKANIYARFQEKNTTFTWFVPIQVNAGVQSVDLTQENQGGAWPFVP
jgi:hypothetical protein